MDIAMIEAPEGGDSEHRNCPLCASPRVAAFFADANRRYFHCLVCDLAFVHAEDRPSRAEESERYRAHQNRRDDAGYVNFLRRLADPLCWGVPVGSRGLDVGCGPVPILSELLTASGRPTLHYDPLFFPRAELLGDTYDFVTCCEVVEHAHDPAALFAQLAGLVRAGGVIAVMTQLRPPDSEFEHWWYRRDSTHVCFFSEATLRWIAQRIGLDVQFPAAGVALFIRMSQRRA